jgi:Xaa-Pro dipeptidase
MVCAGEPQVLAPNMVLFLHMILLNSGTRLSMSLGETAIITETGCEPISHAPHQLLIAEG